MNSSIDPAFGWEYAEDISNLRIPSNFETRNLARHHLSLLEKEEEYYFDWDAASRFLRFCEARMRLKDGEWDGKHFVPLAWQNYVLSMLFGWKKRSDGYRKYSKCFICTGKASGKNIMLASIAYYLASADNEPSSQVVTAAANSAQAKNVFDSIVWSIESLPHLIDTGRLRTRGGEGAEYEVLDRKNNSWLRRVSADSRARGLSGFNLHGLIIDELHEHQSPDLKDVLFSGLGKARRQALGIMATNAGADRFGHAWQEFALAQQISKYPHKTPAYLPVLYHIEKEEEAKDENLWIKANPSYPITPTYLPDRVAEMRGSSARKRKILRLNFGVWDTGGAVSWMPPEKWNSVFSDERPKWAKGRCWVALDLSQRRDLTSCAAIWPRDPKKPDEFYGEVTSWTPQDTLVERTEDRGIPFDDWAASGELTPCVGDIVSLHDVVEFVRDLEHKYGITRIVMDPYRIAEFLQCADAQGFQIQYGKKRRFGVPLALHPQGYYTSYKDDTDELSLSFSRSINDSEDVILNRRIQIRRNAPLKMATEAAMVDKDSKGNRVFNKTKSHLPIDPLVALTMALGCAVADCLKVSKTDISSLFWYYQQNETEVPLPST